ncbi:MAG: GNAT family N-acetyltransferase [Gemmatimonadaceae bacterium]|nr:GNAT family N-acetyltransferase [Gemmatimonadaceae bacterium]NUQ94601.1 GNAT family N-acetyltransferase [Gemmatimonadaceae bacterium]NUR20513.1 GNAT family N-acetyltransferase [Gemmatimonadaceae bacterium]NUS97702.1 GNAT family N-acetyltransferase [Gemmatimonadaceae bacterium]
MATARSWRRGADVSGPHPIRVEDIRPLNEVFSDAFTDRYRRDGLVGVRVPMLNPSVWRYAIEDAAGGAMLWRDERGEIAAFNVAHVSGAEGWMGPLAVRPDSQGMGLGKRIVQAGIDFVRSRGARVIGLETMPRTLDNIGFYSMLGFVPGRLTLTLTLDAGIAERTPVLYGRLRESEKRPVREACAALVQRMLPGYDYSREIELTDSLALGDTVLLMRGRELAGFAICHSVPLVEGRAREELRVLKLVLESETDVDEMLRALGDVARRSGTRRVAIRVQGEYEAVYRRIVALGGRVRWSDLRMSLVDFQERMPRTGVVISNWEI